MLLSAICTALCGLLIPLVRVELIDEKEVEIPVVAGLSRLRAKTSWDLRMVGTFSRVSPLPGGMCRDESQQVTRP